MAGPDVAALAVRIYHDGPTFERIAALADCDMLVLGHTHKPWIHEYGGASLCSCDRGTSTWPNLPICRPFRETFGPRVWATKRPGAPIRTTPSAYLQAL